jgi:transposase-like protein
MSRPRKYPEEPLERGVRLALESDRPIAHVARDLGRRANEILKSASVFFAKELAQTEQK